MVVMVMMAVRLMVMMMVMSARTLPIIGKLHVALRHILLRALKLARLRLRPRTHNVIGLHQCDSILHRCEQIGVGGCLQRL